MHILMSTRDGSHSGHGARMILFYLAHADGHAERTGSRGFDIILRKVMAVVETLADEGANTVVDIRAKLDMMMTCGWYIDTCACSTGAVIHNMSCVWFDVKWDSVMLESLVR